VPGNARQDQRRNKEEKEKNNFGMKYLFAFLLFVHGLIHLMGFAKAFTLGNQPAFSKHISKLTGLLWLMATFLFMAVVTLFLLHKNYWAFFAFAAIILSQTLICIYWKDAKAGTVANIITLLVTISSLFGMKISV
jgi:hypothetical protein